MHPLRWLVFASLLCISIFAIARSSPAVAPAPARAPVDDVPFVSPRAHAVETSSAPNAWGGPRTGKEPTLSDRVVKYEIAATLDPVKHVVDGKERMTWRNRSDRPIKTIYVHLYLNAFEGPGSTAFEERKQFRWRDNVEPKKGDWGHIELVSVAQNGAAVPWTFVHPDDGPATDHTVARFDLPAAVAPGASTTLDVAFRDQLPRVMARTGWWGHFHMVAQWFPKVGVLELPGERGATAPRWNVHEFHLMSEFYADWGEYDVRITVPKGYQVAAAGVEEGAPVENGGMVTRHFVQGDIHDYAWMASDQFAPPLEGGTDVPGGGHVAVRVFYPPEYKASAQPSLQATIDAIQYFSRTLGPYPYKTSTVIVPPFNAEAAGGMEYQTLFTGEGVEVVEPDTIQQYEIDFVCIHEFGHGYFYGILASNEFEEPMLDEGLNEYWDTRMTRDRKQRIHLTTPRLKRLGFDPSGDGFELRRAAGALDPHPSDPIGGNSWDRLSWFSYGQVYSRTATVFHDLEERLGRETIERAFKVYYQRWKFRHPSVADLRDVLVEVSGQRAAVEQVFRQNVYGVEAVDDRVDSVTAVEESPQPGSVYEKGKWTERTKEELEKLEADTRRRWKEEHGKTAKHGEGPYPWRSTVIVRRDGAAVPETMVVTFEDGSTETVKWDDDRLWHRFVFVKPVKVKSAQIDPERKWLLDDDKLNDGRTREPSHVAARRWTADLTAALETLLALGGAL